MHLFMHLLWFWCLLIIIFQCVELWQLHIYTESSTMPMHFKYILLLSVCLFAQYICTVFSFLWIFYCVIWTILCVILTRWNHFNAMAITVIYFCTFTLYNIAWRILFFLLQPLLKYTTSCKIGCVSMLPIKKRP